MSYLYKLLGSKDANGRKPLIGQPKPETAEGMRVVPPTASGASCVLGLQRAWAQPRRTDSSTCSATSSQNKAEQVGWFVACFFKSHTAQLRHWVCCRKSRMT
jgi:hypothetical protein